MKNPIERVLETLLDYYGDFEQSSDIVGMIKLAGEKAGIPSGVRYLEDSQLTDIAAAGNIHPMKYKDKHGGS
jgi:hypothetical protein